MKGLSKKVSLFSVLLVLLVASGCISQQFKLFTDISDPLKEYVLKGKGEKRVLVIHVTGIISDKADDELTGERPSLVEHVVSRLRMAEKDDKIKGLLLKVNSRGGSSTATEMLYHEIVAFKKKKDIPVVVSMTDVAASGGYYISLPADVIYAHPSTITGSIGAIFMRPEITGLMEKIGVRAEINISGRNKDMGSPFRETTEEENELFQNIIEELAGMFVDRVNQHRSLQSEDLKIIKSARIFTSKEAKDRGLIDEIGYLDDALAKTRSLSGLPENAKVVVYRREPFPNDTLYNSMSFISGSQRPGKLELNLFPDDTLKEPGFYYLWVPGKR